LKKHSESISKYSNKHSESKSIQSDVQISIMLHISFNKYPAITFSKSATNNKLI